MSAGTAPSTACSYAASSPLRQRKAAFVELADELIDDRLIIKAKKKLFEKKKAELIESMTKEEQHTFRVHGGRAFSVTQKTKSSGTKRKDVLMKFWRELPQHERVGLSDVDFAEKQLKFMEREKKQHEKSYVTIEEDGQPAKKRKGVVASLVEAE
jgi:hypothetical protein